MYDDQIDGHVIFKYKITPNWITPESKYDELLVIKGYDSKTYVLVRNDYISKDKDLLEDIDFDNDLNNCNVVKELTEEQAEKIIQIIENHKELMSVNSDIYLDVCDGSHEEFYFECPSFNRFTEGDCVFSLDTDFVNTHYSIDELDKNRRDAIVVSKAVKEILFFLERLGVYLYEEDESDLNARKDELLDYLIKASESTSMYYHAHKDNSDEYWPSFKLYTKSGVLFFTSNNRMFDIVKVSINEWKPHRDLNLLEEICNGDNFIMCESHEDNGEYCYTISLKNKFNSNEK